MAEGVHRVSPKKNGLCGGNIYLVYIAETGLYWSKSDSHSLINATSNNDVCLRDHFNYRRLPMDNVMMRHVFAKGILSVFIAVLLIGVSVAITPYTTVHADNTFNVDSTADTVDANAGNGSCADGSGDCTLRAAIMEANALSGHDTINLPSGTYTLAIGGAGEDAAATGDLDIFRDLTIVGAGQATTIIDGSQLDRVFHIHPGALVTISGVTVTNGLAEVHDFLDEEGGKGGGIYNAGILSLSNSTVSGNSAGPGDYYHPSPSGRPGGRGGGIYNTVALILLNSTISGNQTGYGGPGRNGGSGGDGGGIYSTSGVLTLTNSTVSGNQTGYGGSGDDNWNSGDGGRGGGIYSASGMVTLTNSTVSANSTGSGGSGNDSDGEDGSGGGIYNAAGMVKFKSTIISGNTAAGTGPDCSGSLTSYGCNLIQDTTDCTIGGDPTSNITGVDPLLGVLQDNGGPTETHALQSGSPAIDAVIDCDCTTVDGEAVTEDQRGESRPMDGDGNDTFYCDIGAYEAPGPTPLSPYEQGYQEGLEACEKEVVAVGGTVEPSELSELRATEQLYNSDSSDSHIYFALGVGLAAVLALAGGFIAIRRRRAH